MRIAFTHNLQTSHDEAEAEFDREETVAAISDGIRALGHEVFRVNVGGSSAADLVRRLEDLRPELVFNTAEGTQGRFREGFYPGLFEQLGLPFTGSDAYVCTLTLDKQLSKMIVARFNVPTPRWIFVEHVDQLRDFDLSFPVIVKPNFEGSSKGITLESIVEDRATLEARVNNTLVKYPTGLLIEEFIVGRDIVVPWLETRGVMEPAGYRFDERHIGPRKYTIYDYALKSDVSHAVEVECPAIIPAGVRRRVMELSERAFRALGVRDLARIDWRIDEDGEPHFLEVNALPSLEPGAGIYLSAAVQGLEKTEDVLGAVIESAAKRYGIHGAANVYARAKKTRVGLTYNLKRIVPKHAHDDDTEAEYDSESTVDAIASAIASHGHQVVRLEANKDLVRSLAEARVDVVFNVAEGIRGRAREAAVPAMLEMMGVPFTGSEAATMAIALDKAVAKAVVREHGVPTPRSMIMRTGEEPLDGLAFPVIVKPNAEGSSKGVGEKSVVDDEATLRNTVREQVAKYRQEVLVEEFLPGREFTLAVLGEKDAPRCLPAMEIVFTDASTKFPVYGFEHKLEFSSKIRYDRPAQIDDALKNELEAVALGAWRALGIRDVARFDLRCDRAGRVHFIEVNTLPGMTPGWSDLCLIAEAIGIKYEELIGEIMKPALARRETGRI